MDRRRCLLINFGLIIYLVNIHCFNWFFIVFQSLDLIVFRIWYAVHYRNLFVVKRRNIYNHVISVLSVFFCSLDRSVQCNSNQMMVTLEFVQPFLGVVYTNKFYQNKDCKWNGSASRQLQVPIPLNTNPATQPYCGVQLKEVKPLSSLWFLSKSTRSLSLDF